MKAHIFIRSYSKDFPWLHYALRSIAKFCTGFTGVTVVIPAHDASQALTEFRSYKGVAFNFYACPDKPMLRGEIQLCRCDEIVPPDTTHVLLTDSDCIFTCPTVPEDYTINGKPIMVGERFDSMPPNSGCFAWRDSTAAALGFVPEYEFMCRHPAFYDVASFRNLRYAVTLYTHTLFDEYVLSCRNEFPQTFAELTSLGACTHKFCPGGIAFVDKALGWQQFDRSEFAHNRYVKNGTVFADSGNPALMDHLKAFWSHAGVAPHREEIERILA